MEKGVEGRVLHSRHRLKGTIDSDQTGNQRSFVKLRFAIQHIGLERDHGQSR